MKVSPVAIKLSLPGLTNVKKEKVLGITRFEWCFMLSEDKFSPVTHAATCFAQNTIMDYCFYIQYFLLAIWQAASRINLQPDPSVIR